MINRYRLPPPPEDVRELPPELLPPELLVPELPELLREGGLDTAGLLLLPDDGLEVLTEGVLLVGVARRTEELPEFPERLSGLL